MLTSVITEPFCRADLPRLGVSDRKLLRLLASGELIRPFQGVYLPAKLADDPTARAAALGKLLPRDAAVARATAAWLHGLDVRLPGRHLAVPPMQCVVPAGMAPPRRRGVEGFAGWLPADDVVELHGVPVTRLERTALDLARYLPPFMGLAALDALAHEGRVDPAVLAARIEQWRGERYVGRARRLIGLCEPGTESFGESWLRLRIVDAGFPRPEPQIWVPDGDAPVYRLDLGWRERRVGIEYDGEEFHSADRDRRHDEERRERLYRDYGWCVIGVDRGDVLGRGMQLELGVGELLGMRPGIARRPW